MSFAAAPEPTPSPVAFHHRAFFLYWLAGFAAAFAIQIVSVSVGWQIYDLTRNPLDLGIAGLVQFLPALLLVLVTGLVADRYNRRGVMAACLGLEILCVGLLTLHTFSGGRSVWPIFALLAGLGVARAFFNPASDSLAPNLVPPEALANAIAMTSTSWQIANIVGPVLGGLLYGVTPYAAFGVAFAMMLAAGLLVVLIPKPPQHGATQATTLESLFAGFRYVWSEKIVLGAISLDLFAVLLGGAVALMPVFARDILEVGPWGLGLMRSAPGVGAIVMALYLARYPIRDRAGIIMFVCVAIFGLFTAVFGLSTSVPLSILALVVMGAADMVSVYVRETLLQLWTPDQVRGRVNAVNRVFIGASNELGEFRAGVMAFWIGAVAAVSLGGIGTMGVAGLWALMFPKLRRARHLQAPAHLP